MAQLNAIKDRLTGAGGKISKPKFSKQDAMAGLTTGIANVPDGMASGVLAGVNPIYGIYTLIIGTPIAAMTASTQLMMFNTTSAMTLVAVDGLGATTGEERVQRLIIVALIAGVFQLALGLLGLGMLTKFVSNSVMVGFLTGIAALIIMAQLWDLTGFVGESGTRLQNTALLLTNLREVDPATTAIGLGSLALMLVLARSPKLGNFNLLIALGVSIVIQLIFSFGSVATVGEIPSSLPQFQFPEFRFVGTMLIAGVATGAVGLLQAAGVAQAFPNPDGSETSDSRDFQSQGVANIATSFFSGMAGGGSLSGTALNVSAGAVTRFANVVQAGVVLLVILVFSGVLAKIPSAALAALLIYAAALSIKWAAIYAISRSSWMSIAAMLLTFLATLVVPLQQAVMFGVLIAGVLFIYRASIDVVVNQMVVENGQLHLISPPDELPSDKVTVLDIEGNLFYAGARTMSHQLPDATDASNAFVIMRVRGQSDLGTTFFKVIGKYAEQIESGGGRFILAGVADPVRARMQKSGALDAIGPENVFSSSSILGDSTLAAIDYGQSLLEGVPKTELDLQLASMSSPGIEALSAPPLAPAPADSEVTDNAEELTRAAVDTRASVVARIAGFVDTTIPWRTAPIWKATGLLGIVLAVLGLLQILWPNRVEEVFRGLVGLVMIGVAFFWIYQTLSEKQTHASHRSELRMLSAGIALMGGMAMLFAEYDGMVSTETGRLFFGLAVVMIGVIGLASTDYAGIAGRDRQAAIGMHLFTIAIGVISLIQLNRGTTLLSQVAWLLLAIGLVLLAYAVYLLRSAPASLDLKEPSLAVSTAANADDSETEETVGL